MRTSELADGTLARRAGATMAVVLLAVPLGAFPARGQTIAGRVVDGDVGVSNVTVQAVLSGQTVQTATTGTNGNYALTGLSPGITYTVTPTKSDTVFQLTSCLFQSGCTTNTSVTVLANATNDNINFAVVYSITGSVTTNGITGVSGVRVSVQNHSQIFDDTDSTGTYLLAGLPKQDYVLVPSKTSFTFDPPTRTVTVISNMTGQNFTAYAAFTVSGRVFNGRSPLAGVEVTLLHAETNFMTTTTSATGSFAFQDLPAGIGNYTVIPSLSGYAFNPPSVVVTGPATITFTVVAVNVTGHIREGNNGLAGVPVYAISPANTIITNTTDPNGQYTFKNLAGTYAIMPDTNNGPFNPARRTFSVGSATGSVNFDRGPTMFDTLISTCDFPSLSMAFSTGGTVGFDCGSALLITNTETITIATNVTLDAQGQDATLSGGSAVRLFTVNPGVNFTLKGMKLTAGKDTGASGTNGTPGIGGEGGVIFNDGGTNVLSDCVLSANSSAGGTGGNGAAQLNGNGGSGGDGGSAFGGAIFNNGGLVAATNCTFAGNSATAGAGGNGADASSGGNGNSGGNGGDGGVGTGGAIYNSKGTVALYDCTFASNTVSGATGGSGGAGTGLGSNGANGAPGPGCSGAVHNAGGNLLVLFSTFNNNVANGVNGADGRAGTSGTRGASGTRGGAASGGAICNSGGSVAATNCTFDSNMAAAGNGGNGGGGGSAGFGGDGGDGGNGGAGSGGAIWNADNGTNVLVNCTITGNEALGGLGGSGGTAGTSVAKPGHDGPAGVGDGGGIANGSGPVTLENTVLGYSPDGGNAAGDIVDGGNNLSDDASIALTGPGSLGSTNLDLKLGLLGDYGGPTWTVPILFADSPAVNRGNDLVAPNVDQRHQARVGPSDVGAFEFLSSVILTIKRQPNTVVLSWDSTLVEYQLQSSPNLPSTNWTFLTNTFVVGSQFVVTNSTDGPGRFYRLIWP